MTKARRIWIPTLAMLVVSAILGALGTWQVNRLFWKEALIARVAARIHAAPVPLPPVSDITGQPEETYEYRTVSVAGEMRSPREFHVFGVLGSPRGTFGGPGWWVIVPVTLADGMTLFVNAGFVPDNRKDTATRSQGLRTGPIRFTGTLRGADHGNLFTPSDDAGANRYFVRDPKVFAQALGLDPAKVYPVTVDMDEASLPPGGLPQPGETLVTFPNSHLGYALTWYGLMLTAIGVWIAWMRGALRRV